MGTTTRATRKRERKKKKKNETARVAHRYTYRYTYRPGPTATYVGVDERLFGRREPPTPTYLCACLFPLPPHSTYSGENRPTDIDTDRESYTHTHRLARYRPAAVDRPLFLEFVLGGGDYPPPRDARPTPTGVGSGAPSGKHIWDRVAADAEATIS